jgi:hypothetical protein
VASVHHRACAFSRVLHGRFLPAKRVEAAGDVPLRLKPLGDDREAELDNDNVA